MGKFVQVAVNDVKKYECISKEAFKKIPALVSVLKFEKILPVGRLNKIEIFYDTRDNLLTKAGVVVSKVNEGGKAYFKIQRQSFIPSSFMGEDKIYIHEIGPRDKISDHTFYITDGIKELYTTSFSIDVENVVKKIFPKLVIKTKIQRHRIVSGTGFRGLLDEENITIINKESKRKVNKFGVTFRMDCNETYQKQFNEQTKRIEKFVKELLPIKDSEYEYAIRLTKPIVREVKKDDKKQKHKKKK